MENKELEQVIKKHFEDLSRQLEKATVRLERNIFVYVVTSALLVYSLLR